MKPVREAKLMITFEDGSQEGSSVFSFHCMNLKEISPLQSKKEKKSQVSGNRSFT
jgi:hypothetical protein